MNGMGKMDHTEPEYISGECQHEIILRIFSGIQGMDMFLHPTENNVLPTKICFGDIIDSQRNFQVAMSHFFIPQCAYWC